MAQRSDDLPNIGDRPGQGPLTPDEERDIESRLEAVRRQKAEALKDPGPTWSEWFYYRGAKWYVVVGFLILLSWEIGYAFPPISVPVYEVAPLAVGTAYAEYLLYEYLWYRPTARREARSTRPERARRWYVHPAAYGRWTPEGADIRAGRPVLLPESGPDVKEFL